MKAINENKRLIGAIFAAVAAGLGAYGLTEAAEIVGAIALALGLAGATDSDRAAKAK